MCNTVKPSSSLVTFHENHIKGTLKKASITDATIILCNISGEVKKICNWQSNTVYVSTRMLKHLYDKRPAVQYDFILENLYLLIQKPDHIFVNKSGKRGNFGFCKCFTSSKVFASLEVIYTEGREKIFVATTFEVDERYMKNCTLIWSWRDGTPSSQCD